MANRHGKGVYFAFLRDEGCWEFKRDGAITHADEQITHLLSEDNMNKKLSLFELLEFSTVRLETVDAQGKLWASSGFFYTVSKKDDPNKGQVFIITNRHAVEGMEKITFCMSKMSSDGGPLYDKPLRHEIAIQSVKVIYLEDKTV